MNVFLQCNAKEKGNQHHSPPKKSFELAQRVRIHYVIKINLERMTSIDEIQLKKSHLALNLIVT